MTRLGVDLGLLDELVAAMEVAARSLAEIRADVDRSVGQLQAVWCGGAAQAQAGAQRQWTAGEAEMRAALVRLREIAAGAASNYRAAVAANQRIWQC